MSAGGTGQAAGQAGDRPARDPAGAAVLERRYRCVLRCYPPAHREVHREEMLGVLLATARPAPLAGKSSSLTYETGADRAKDGLSC